MPQHNETPDEDPDFQDLEKKLVQLKPMAPSDAFARRLTHKLDALDRDRAEKKIVWVRFAPVAAAACVVLTSAFLYRDYLMQQQKPGSKTVAGPETVPAEGLANSPAFDGNEPASPPARNPMGEFVRVSDESILKGFENGGIIGTENDGRPVREWRLEIENTEYWYNPETRTNLRIQRPGMQYLQVPVETN